jgi:hypothetical protein
MAYHLFDSAPPEPLAIVHLQQLRQRTGKANEQTQQEHM